MPDLLPRSARLLLFAFAFAFALSAGACSVTPDASSVSYKSGSLGNGAFLFACDDSVACAKWNGNAKLFPTAITTGSSFSLYFVANEDEGNANVSSGQGRYPGMTLEAVGPYMGKGPDGFAALRPGYGAVVAHDRDGKVIDYVSLHIVQPEALVVYDASYTGDNPPPVDTLSLAPGDRPSYRTVGETSGEPSAGSINVAWTSDDPTTLVVESYTRSVVTVRALRPGHTKLTAVGAALTKPIPVDVQ